MHTEIKQVSSVEYELDIRATAEDIEPKLNKALRRQRSQTDMKGFRKGKVPLTLVKKMHGETLGYGVAEQMVQEAFETEVEEGSDLEVLGQPQLTELNYELDGDLHAVIRFGVRPEIELKDLSGEQISRLAHEVTDDDVEDEIEQFRREEADLIPVDDEPAEETDYVMVDLQRIDPSTNTPVIGDKEEDLSFFLDDERLKDELREALIGKTAGETFRVDLPREPDPQQDDGEPEVRVYEVTLKDVKRRELPDVDEALVHTVTDGQFEDPEAFRQEIRDQLEEAWGEQSREMLQGRIIERMLDLHTVPVPQSVVETYLDSFVEQVKQQNDGELPDDFDMELFRTNQEGEAERQGRWMLIRDALIEEAGIEVTDEDLQAFFEEQAEGDEQISTQQLQQFYRSMPKLMERVRQQVLSQKVFDELIDRFDVVDKSMEEFEKEMEAEHAHAHDHGEASAEREAPAGASPIITE